MEIAKSIGSPNADAFSVRVVKNSKSKIFSFTLKDKFIHTYWSNEDLFEAHGFSTKQINKKLEKIL